MTLSQRTVLIIVSTFIALLFILAATSDVILLKSFAALERTVLAGDVQKIRNELNEVYDDLLSLSRDMDEVVITNGASHISDLKLQFFVNHRIDLVACFSKTGQVLSSQSVDFHKNRFTVLSQADLAGLAGIVPLIKTSADNSIQGMIMLGGQPLQLVLRPINSDLMILVGRYLDAEEIRRISVLTDFDIEFFSVAQESQNPDIAEALAAFGRGESDPSKVISADQLAGYAQFRDAFGQPLLVARVVEQRLLYQQGKASIAYVLLALFLAGGVFCCVTLFFIRGMILKRIESFGATVKKISSRRDMTSRLPISSENDELTELAESINAMLDSLESAENLTRDSQERYRVLFERAPDSLFIVGLDGDEAGKIISANKSAAEQHGYTVEELCSMSIFKLVAHDSRGLGGKLIDRIIRGEWITKEIWHYRKDGSQFPSEVNAGMVRIQGRSYILAFDRDITSRKLAEESDRMYLDTIRSLNSELNRKAGDLAAANYELEAFNYSVSHDMRGPLTRISGYCQILLEDDLNLDEHSRTYISRIHEAGLWLNDMIEAMLELSRLARSEFVQEQVDLSRLAETVVGELESSEPGRVVETIIMPDVVVAGDPKLLKILITNLLGNAWKYSSLTREARIEFGQQRDQSVPVYYVRDNGAGFDMQSADKLFRVFSRLHEHSQFSGTGIGLATVKRIVTRHGGRIWAEAAPGRGAAFFFTLQPEQPPVDEKGSSALLALDWPR